MTTAVENNEKTIAPHGRDENGKPNAPYGLKLDGTPKLSNRGAKPGQRGNGGSATPKAKRPVGQSLSDVKRKEMLVSLADMLVVTPLASISASPILAKKIGANQTDALAGDAVIVSHFMPDLAESLIVLSQTKPSVLSWMDTVEEKAPYLMLMQVGLQMTKAFIGNHMSPDRELADAGRSLARIKAAQMAAAVQAEADAMGLQAPHQGA